MNIYIDIDDTICYYSKDIADITKKYHYAVPNYDKIKIVNKLYNKGHNIVMWTARGAVSGIDWTELTKKQLSEWGVKYHKLKLDKPAFDLFVDDKALTTLEQIDFV